MNHKKIAEGFSKGVRQIGDNLEYLSRSKNSLNTAHSRKAIANAYVEVFKFLCYALRWQASRWSRFSSAVNNSSYDNHIKTHVDEVERLAKLVDRETQRHTYEEVVEIGSVLGSSGHQTNMADRFRKQDGPRVEASFEDASKAFSRLGDGIVHCLTAAEDQQEYGM